MGREDRPWERKPDPDGEINRTAASAMTGSFLLVMLVVVAVGGFSLVSMAIGLGIASLVAVLLGKAISSSDKGSVRPPKDLL